MNLRRNGKTPPPTNGAVIHMRAIRKVYDTGKIQVEALRGIDLDVRPGEFIAIVGPSGSGKSTLMNLIGCLDTPTDGLYQLRGEAVAGMKRDQLADIRNRRVGFVFQNFNLLPQITAYENVEMPLLFGGVGKKMRRQRVEELFEKVGLADRMEHKPTELSGGQDKALARRAERQVELVDGVITADSTR
jgi:putative ABC transport system ATP-binding protein